MLPKSRLLSSQVTFDLYFALVISYNKLDVCEAFKLLLHIMCGYQCDKAVTKNDTHEVI